MKQRVAWFLFAAFLIASIPSKAQFTTSLNRYRKSDKEKKVPLQLHKRIYLGLYGQHLMSNPLYLRIRDTSYVDSISQVDRVGGRAIDTNIQTTARLSKVLTGYIGVSVPVAHFGEKSMISIDIEANALMGELTYDTVYVPKILADKRDTFYSENMPFMMLSGPISVNFKWGGDASLSKDHKAMFAAGAGIAASYISVDPLSGGQQDPLIKAVPFVKAEVGFFLGIAWKLRGTAYLGQYDMINVKSAELSSAAGIIEKRYAGPLGYNFSLMAYPLSFMWDKPVIR